MSYLHVTILTIASIFEIIGLILLAKEVLLGQESEEVQTDSAINNQFIFFYALKDYKSYFISVQLDIGFSAEQVQGLVQGTGIEKIEELCHDHWASINSDRDICKHQHNLRNKIYKRAIEIRRKNLVTGTWLLVLAAVLLFILELVK